MALEDVMVSRLLLAAFLVAHGLIHLTYLAPEPPDAGTSWPFAMDRSWLVGTMSLDAGVVRSTGYALIAIVVLGYVLSAAAVLGALPAAWWAPLAICASVTSLVVLALFFHPWILLGFAIDGAILWAALIARWVPAD